MDTALMFVNARHAAFHRERREIDTAVQLTQALAEHMPLPGSRQRYGSFLRVSAAARKVGVTRIHQEVFAAERYFDRVAYLAAQQPISCGATRSLRRLQRCVRVSAWGEPTPPWISPV